MSQELPTIPKSTKKNKLSYSQLRLYNECGRKYQLYYIDRLREKTRTSALFFGTAFDKATEAVLRDSSVNEREVFDKWWQRQKLNNEEVYLPDSVLVVYSNSDFDVDVLLPEDIQFIKAKALEYVPQLYEECGQDWLKVLDVCLTHKKQKDHRVWLDSERKFFGICSWLSLRRKAYLMFEANRKYIIPKLKVVHSVQKEITLNNGDGDTLIGFADLIGEFEDNVKRVMDYKTTSMPYKADSVATSPQLTLYSHALEIPDAAFITFNKKIRKIKIKICSLCKFDGTGRRFEKCPECSGEWNVTLKLEVDVQMILDKIPAKIEDEVLENIEVVNTGIKTEQFLQNLDSCRTPYGLCPYYNKCHNNSDEGLEKV